MLDTGLAGRVALITGANRPHGIGAAIARALAAQGARPFLHYHRVAPPDGDQVGAADLYHREANDDAQVVLEGLREQGVRAAAFEADLADPASAPAVFDACEAALGPVDVLVCNHAHWQADTLIPPGAALSNHLPETWSHVSPLTAATLDAHFAVNARTVALLMAEYARRFVDRGGEAGRIVNISTDGARCFPSEVSYGASKLALEGLSRSAAVEFGPLGIAVNVVSPGPVQTGWITPELEAAILPSIPLGRVGQPEDIADAVVFLASQQARWITGQVLHVGGGNAM